MNVHWREISRRERVGGEEVVLETGVGRRISGIAGGRGKGHSCLGVVFGRVEGRVESFCVSSVFP